MYLYTQLEFLLYFFQGDIVFVKQLRIPGFELKSKARNYIKVVRRHFSVYACV